MKKESVLLLLQTNFARDIRTISRRRPATGSSVRDRADAVVGTTASRRRAVRRIPVRLTTTTTIKMAIEKTTTATDWPAPKEASTTSRTAFRPASSGKPTAARPSSPAPSRERRIASDAKFSSFISIFKYP